jgi:hypothetical protein
MSPFGSIPLWKKVLASKKRIIVIIKIARKQFLASNYLSHSMKIEFLACLLSLALLPACSTTNQTTAERQTLEQRLMAKYASSEVAAEEPAPPAEGPEDIPAAGPTDPEDNPALLPTPLLRYWASSRTP